MATYRHRVSNPHPFYHSTACDTTTLPVCRVLDYCSEFLLYIATTDYWSNFAKTILFENCSCFSKKPFSISVESPRIFRCLISIPAGHWVREIDGDRPRRFFLSALLSLVISMIGRSWAHIKYPSSLCVCTRVYKHTHTPHPNTRKNRETYKTKPLPLPLPKHSLPRQKQALTMNKLK